MTRPQPSEADRCALVQRATEKLLQQAKQARQNPRDFFSFVIREETTRARVQCLPFQTVIFKFVEHFDRCVIRIPVGFSKTFTMAALSMQLIGNDPTTRGAIISSSEKQAKKPVGMVRDYIETSPELRLVYPKLRPSTRDGDPWTQTQITVDRPPGIRDASLSAVGLHGKLPGARLNWILVDDILNEENTRTAEQRKTVTKFFTTSVLSRRDIKGTKIVVTNTPWHPDDLTYLLERAGWPTLTMDIDGNIYFTNTCETDLVEGAKLPIEGEFDCDEIRPSHMAFPVNERTGKLERLHDTKGKAYRLAAHDAPEFDPAGRGDARFFDTNDEVPLWPQKFGRAEIDRLIEDYRGAMHEFNQLYRARCRDDEAARVKVSWIDACKEEARKRDIFTYASKWDGPAVTGVDLAVGKKRRNDRSSVFTFGIQPDRMRRVLRLDSARLDGSSLIDLVIEHHRMFGSIVGVENNAAQDYLRQWMRERDLSLPIRGETTGSDKHSKEFGVESIFVEVENKVWLFPNDYQGRVTEAMQRLFDAMLYYDPSHHTGDELMSMWIAMKTARKAGLLRRPDRGKRQAVGMLAGMR